MQSRVTIIGSSALHSCAITLCAITLRRVADCLRAAEAERQETQKAREAMQKKLLDIAGEMSAGSKRQQLGKDVFKPSHILPTYTVEQAGIIELAEVRCRNAQSMRMRVDCPHRAQFEG
jgi:hypothetical protein